MKDKEQEIAGIADLVKKMKAGDEAAFASLYTQTYKFVYSRAKSMFSDEGEALDLVQEVYLALYRNKESIQFDENIFGWLKTTTFYQGTKMLQKKRKEVLLTEEGEGMFETLPDEDAQIEEDFAEQEDIEVIRACIERLSDEQKTVLLAYYYDNLKVGEIAEILSISEGTVKSRLHLARKNLKTHIEVEEKKRGYKLHSFGAVTLALALRVFLQSNVESAVVAEETVFSRLCECLNFNAVKAIRVQSTTSQKVVKESGKRLRNKFRSKIAEFGAKKIVLSAAGIVAATVIGGVVTIGLKEDKELQQWQVNYAHILFELLCAPDEVQEVEMSDSLFQKDMDEYVQQFYEYCHNDIPEEMQLMFGLANKDAEDTPELLVEFRSVDGKKHNQYMFESGDSIVECYVGGIDYDSSVEFYELNVANVLKALDVQISEEDSNFLAMTHFEIVNRMADFERNSIRKMKIGRVWFDDDGAKDFVFLGDKYIDILGGGEPGWECEFRTLGENIEYYAYVEKQAKLIIHLYYDEYDARDKMTVVRAEQGSFRENSVCMYWDTEQSIMKYRIHSFDNLIMEYAKYWDEDGKPSWPQITEAEYRELYNEICKDEINLIKDVSYENVLDIIYDMEIMLKE